MSGRRKRRWGLLLLFALVASLVTVTSLALPALPASATAPAGLLAAYPSAVAAPAGVANGPDGNLWYTNRGTNAIGRVTPAGVFSQYSDLTVNQPDGITAGPDGNVWFRNSGDNSIGRISPSGVLAHFASPSISAPDAITAGPDGNVWFTSLHSVGRITPSGAVTTFADPLITSPVGITTGPDGNIWITDAGNSIERITPAGVTTRFTDVAIFGPQGIAAGPDGALWFTKSNANAIGRITTSGVVTNFEDEGLGRPTAITAGPDGALWFTRASLSTAIGRITTTGSISYVTASSTEIQAGAIVAGGDGNLWLPDRATDSMIRVTPAGDHVAFPDPSISRPFGLTEGPDRAVWYTNGGADTIGRISVTGQVTHISDASIHRPVGITTGPDGNLWFTNNASASIGRVTPAGVVSTFTDASINQPDAITAGPDGALWFTNDGNSSIDRITVGGVVTHFSDPSVHSPTGITTGSDGNLWFVNSASNTIGRITPSGSITHFGDPSIAIPWDIARGPDGALWFTNADSDRIGRITTAGAVTSFEDGSISSPMGITPGPDGALWFTNRNTSTIGRITTTGSVSHFAGREIDGPQRIVAGHDHDLWFTQTYGLGKVTSGIPAFQPLPTGVTAVAHSTDVDVSWQPPVDSDYPILGYDVEEYVSGVYVAGFTVGTATTASAFATPGTTYTYRILVQTIAGWSGPSEPSAPVTAGSGTTYHPIAPRRILDTRPPPSHVGSLGPWGPGQQQNVQVGSYTSDLPPEAEAVVLNVTVTGGTANGDYLTIWPEEARRPTVSSLNFGAGQTVANQVTVPLGGSYSNLGSIWVFNAAGSVDVIVDVSGYYDLSPGDQFTALPPSRLIDSRPPPSRTGPLGPWGAGVTQEVQVTGGSSGVPSDADAVVLNVTATGGSANGDYLSIWPSGGAKPVVSSLNMNAGRTVPNAVTVKLGTGAKAGRISIFNASGTQDVIVDIAGYFEAGVGKKFYPQTPMRIIDTRPVPNRVGPLGSWVGSSTQQVQAASPATAVPAGADSVVLNVTATGGNRNGDYLSIWPAGSGQPTVSSLNFDAGSTVANAVTVKVGTGGGAGAISIFNAAGTVDGIVDIAGYYA